MKLAEDRKLIRSIAQKLPPMDAQSITNLREIIIPSLTKDTHENIGAFIRVKDMAGFEDIADWIAEEESLLSDIDKVSKHYH